MYEDIYTALSNVAILSQGTDLEVLDFGSRWYGDGRGGWQTSMRTLIEAVVAPRNVKHTLATYPEYDIESLVDVSDGAFDFVVADQVLEHVERPWLAAREIARVTVPGGIAMVATPGLYPIHPSPLDCWRIMPDGYRVLFPRTQWHWLVQNMWGDLARMTTEYVVHKGFSEGAPSVNVAKAKQESLIKQCFCGCGDVPSIASKYEPGTDGRYPLVIWWLGIRR
jgi:SAM-dependent methyltransferase